MKSLPEILTANTYFWKPSQSASGRRANESRRVGEVDSFLKSLGFKTEVQGTRLTGVKDTVEVSFSYTESCGNVYKSFDVYLDGKKKDIRLIKKLLNK